MENVKLTEKQERFIDYYIQLGNATEAARRAGYSDRTARAIGNENLTKPYIKLHIDRRLKELEDKRIAKAEEVMEYLTSVMRGEESEEVVVTENIGDFMSEARTILKQVSARERIKAAELIGKRYALFTDKVNIDGNLGVQIIDDIPEDEENEED